MYKGYLPSDKNIPKVGVKNAIKNGKLYTEEQIKGHLGDYVGILKDEFIMLDFDSEEISNKMLEIVKGENLKCNILKTDRGIHVYFLNTNLKQNSQKIKNYLGLEMDYKLGSNNTIEPLVKGGKMRKWIKWIGKEVDELPFYLHPFKKANDMSNSTCRNSNLFGYILPLQGEGISKDNIEQIIRLINTYILTEKLDRRELDTILRDEAFSKPVFFVKNKFQHHVFGNYYMSKKNIVKIDNITCQFKGGVYTDLDIEADILDYVENMTSSQRKEVLSYINLNVKDKKQSPAKYILLGNGVLDLETMDLLEYSEKFIFRNKINWNYNPNAKSESVDTVLNNIVCGDENLRLLFEEVLGYGLFRRNELGKFFMFFGGGRNGKSTYLQLMQDLYGEFNISGLDLEDIGDKYRTAEMIGKLVNIGDDISNKYIEKNNTLKKVVTGSMITTERKNANPVLWMNPYVKIFFSCNKLPRMNDTSNGLKRRMVLIPFLADFTKFKDFDPFIIDKIKTQESMEYALLLALKGLKRIWENRKFTNVESVNKSNDAYEKFNNPVLQFLEEKEVMERITRLEKIKVDDLYKEYGVWCLESGNQSLSKSNFISEMEVLKIEKKQRSVNRIRTYYFENK